MTPKAIIVPHRIYEVGTLAVDGWARKGRALIAVPNVTAHQSTASVPRAGLTIVPFMPWHRAPPLSGGPPRPPAKFFLTHNVL